MYPVDPGTGTDPGTKRDCGLMVHAVCIIIIMNSLSKDVEKEEENNDGGRDGSSLNSTLYLTLIPIHIPFLPLLRCIRDSAQVLAKNN